MNTETILQTSGETYEYARQYIDHQKTLIQLEIAEKTAKTTSALVTSAVLGLLGLLFLIMFSIATGFWLGEIWGSYAAAFLAITAFYGLLGALVYFYQKTVITNPILNKVVKEMLD